MNIGRVSIVIKDICPKENPSILSSESTGLKTIIFGTNSKYIKNEVECDSSGNCFIYINGIMSNEEVVLSIQLLLCIT